jgi:hypothetical protein
MAICLSFGNPVLAQAPANDLVSWPPGLLLLATILYASLGSSADHLWEIEPATGFSMWSGLPLFSIPAMKRMRWASPTCHFIPGIRSAYGTTNFWVRSAEVTPVARSEALNQALSVLSCVVYEEKPFDQSLWKLTTDGLVHPLDDIPPPHKASLPIHHLHMTSCSSQQLNIMLSKHGRSMSTQARPSYSPPKGCPIILSSM